MAEKKRECPTSTHAYCIEAGVVSSIPYAAFGRGLCVFVWLKLCLSGGVLCMLFVKSKLDISISVKWNK